MALSPQDQKLLRSIIDLGHTLERLWSDSSTAEAIDAFRELKALVSSAEAAESDGLKRLAFHERNLTPEMTAKHLSTILVPFERLHGRALRDDEFLVSETDRPSEQRETAPLIVIADNLRSAFNVGSILRTAEAFGAERVWLTGYTPTPDEEKTSRTSMGAQNFIPWESLPSAQAAITKARSQGYSVIALETAKNAAELGNYDWPEKCALILGNERFGVDREALANVDGIVRIPLHGRKNSLNVGTAFGIAAADWRRSRIKSSDPKLIGVFHASALHPYEARRQGSISDSDDIGVIELKTGGQFEQALEDLEGFEKIWIIYQFHRNPNWKPKVLPPRGPRIKRGVFATRSPYRPSGIGLSCVDLIKIEGRKIHVRGFDILDGTPIYDIKPYLPYADAFPDARAGWTEGLDQNAFVVAFSPLALSQLTWLKEHGVDQMHGFLKSQLEHDPIDDERKRVEPVDEHHYCISYRTWRADFKITARAVEVENIYSGYTIAELASSEDRYNDKATHRAFNSAAHAKHGDSSSKV